MTGEVAEMMLDGTLCSQCGSYLGSRNDFPTMCAGCEADAQEIFPRVKNPPPKLPCPVCMKRVKATGLRDHMRDVHKHRYIEPGEYDRVVQQRDTLIQAIEDAYSGNPDARANMKILAEAMKPPVKTQGVTA